MNHFMEACQADERMVAAFIGGSYARGKTDAYSDLDLYLITSDETYDDFTTSLEVFMRRLGEPLFLEVYNDYGFDLVLFIFANGTEG
jgi:predicted nucleotidyltransferase